MEDITARNACTSDQTRKSRLLLSPKQRRDEIIAILATALAKMPQALDLPPDAPRESVAVPADQKKDRKLRAELT